MSAGATRVPTFGLIARYRSAFAAAWQRRHQESAVARHKDDIAFLPAAQALQETPPHPAPRWTAMTLCALFALALAWSIVGQIDVVAVAQGRLVVSDRSKLVQPLEAGVVRAIHVADGDRVRRGQMLVELDATQPQADAARLTHEREHAYSEAIRSRTLLDALDSGHAPALGALPATTGGADEQRKMQAELDTEWGDIRARLAKLEAELTRRRAELVTAERVVAKLEVAVPLARQREADYLTLAQQGFTSNHGAQDRTRERAELEQDLSTAQARRTEAQAAIAESQHSRLAYIAETVRSLRQRQTDAELKQAQLREESVKASQRGEQTRLASPVDGTVQQLAVHTTGGVVTPAQTLLVVVPDGADLTIEATLENKDVGFVREGQEALVKLETFPFTRYGTVRAKVRTVSADAVQDDKRGGAVFPVTLALSRSALDVDGRIVRLSPGMNVTAEIRTGRRRVIEFLLSPLQKQVNESMNER